MKVVGATLLSLQHPFLLSLDNAMKTEAAKQGIDWGLYHGRAESLV
jgi:hypothetical protein